MSDLSSLKIRSMRERVSPDEWRTRVDLAACYRLVHHYGTDDLVYNHISARVPGEEGHFLINAHGLMYDEISASSLVKIDFDGNVVLDSGTGYGINQAGFVIHSAVHEGRPDVGCVIHTHSIAGMAISAQDVIEKTHHLYRPGTRRRWGPLEWPALLRLADRKHPGFRD